MSLPEYAQNLAYQGTAGPEIELENLYVSFQKTHIIEDISLRIPQGKTTAIVGPNGSGKTTLLKAILGQYQHKGHVRIYWQSKDKQRIAYVPQYIDFDRELPMNGKDFLGILLQKKPIFSGLHKRCQSVIRHLFQKMEMSAHRHKKIGKLSGGELKRLVIAQALYPEPELILLDEPLVALDEPGTELFFSMLSELQSMGKTIIWVEHDLMAVQKYAQHLIAVNRRIIHQGSPSDLSDPVFYSRIFLRSSKAH
ncbi:metal ABC transporter ATP-binding protein [Oligella urethralis]|uniref:metal ABC transporter ATP-binding protein n=1 Tax=Oligella urethralis TaxID=90245 RepID=UPI00066132F2|nr:metal ABC transporter ATP-binding protein [Oligella urethralis]